MTETTESECLAKHKDALGEAHRACQRLGKNAAEGVLKPRGRDYANLKTALEELEGSARQIAMFRRDARWLRLGILYAKTLQGCQRRFVGQRWTFFRDLMPLFENGKVQLEQLQAKTGVIGAILPQRASEWLIMPEWRAPKTPLVRIN